MELQNGYKVIYEKAADGERTFYASKSNAYPDTEDLVLATFKDDVDFKGRTIYEYKGKFYITAVGKTPAYGEDGIPTDECINSDNFDLVFTKAEDVEEVDEPVEDEVVNEEEVEEEGNENTEEPTDTTPVVEE